MANKMTELRERISKEKAVNARLHAESIARYEAACDRPALEQFLSASAAEEAMQIQRNREYVRALEESRRPPAEAVVGDDWVEVIETEYMTGMVKQVIRPWDGAPSLIGTVEPRNGRADGSVTVIRPTLEL